MSFATELQARSAEIDEQARVIEQCADPATRNAALALLRSIMELHRSALQEMLEVVADKCTEPETILDALARRPLIHGVLLLHDLHPHDLEKRIAWALEELQPNLQRHNAEARLISIADGVVRIFLEAPLMHGSKNETLKSTIEKVLIDAAPDAEISVQSAPEPESNFVPVEALHPAADHVRSKWNAPGSQTANAGTSVQHSFISAMTQTADASGR